MPKDFDIRRSRVQTLRECLNSDDEARSLMSAFELSQKAGATIAPLLSSFHIAVDFKDPSHCRIDGNTLILLVHSSVQENRLRQLLPRMRAELAVAGLPLSDVTVHLIPKTVIRSNILELPKGEPRQQSSSGAAAIDGIIGTLENESLKKTMMKLRDALQPESDNRAQALEERLAAESLALATERASLETLVHDLSYGIESFDIPSEEETIDYPRLESLRQRLLEELGELQQQMRDATRRVTEIDERLNTINDALIELPVDPVRAEEIARNRRSDDSDAPEPLEPRHQPSAAGAAAIASLVGETHSPRLKKTLRRLQAVLEPGEKDYADELRENIRREIRRLLLLSDMVRSEEQKKRLSLLRQALSEIDEDPSLARIYASRLYGSVS